MTTPPLTAYLDGTVLVVRMDDGKANALSHEMIAALDGALDRALSEAAAVLIVGREGRFSGGFDLRVMMEGPEAVRGLMGPGAELLLRLLEHPQPVAMACTGHAIAAGALLLLTADLRIGADGEFKIGLNEVSQGMTVPCLAVELARHRLAAPSFVEATTLAELYRPRRAAAVGYLDEVIAAEDLIARASEEARRLAALPGHAFAGSKQRVRGPIARLIRDGLQADFDLLLGES